MGGQKYDVCNTCMGIYLTPLYNLPIKGLNCSFVSVQNNARNLNDIPNKQIITSMYSLSKRYYDI